jgi:hypothetical protein
MLDPARDITIVYYYDNTLPAAFAERMQRQLARCARKENNIPIISVSQKPIKFGWNICMGDIGRSYFSLYKQVITGCRYAETPYVALCEADVFYQRTHFHLRPDQYDGIYDQNCHRFLVKQRCFCLYRGGRSLFLLVGDREKIIENFERKLALFKTEKDFSKRFEPGKGEAELGLPPFTITPGAGAYSNIHICNHGYNLSPKAKRPAWTTDMLPDGMTVDEAIREWEVPVGR